MLPHFEIAFRILMKSILDLEAFLCFANTNRPWLLQATLNRPAYAAEPSYNCWNKCLSSSFVTLCLVSELKPL